MFLKRALLVSVCAGGAALAASGPARPAMPIVATQQDPPQGPTNLVLVLSNGANHPKVGVPDFQAPGGDAAQREVAALVADVLWNDLDFEREFSMIPRRISAGLPAAATPEALPFAQWRELGTEFVIIGSIRPAGAEFTVDLRMVSVRSDSPGQQVFGSIYEHCTARNPRYCAHSIADDIHKRLRSLDGVARTQLAFTSDRDGARMANRPMPDAGVGKEIYIADYDGANPRRATFNQSLNITPAWAPSRGLLAYTSYISGQPDIYVANLVQPGKLMRPANGTDRVKNYSPAWSPDGTKIAFMSFRNDAGTSDIYVVNSDGTEIRNLTNTPNADEGCPTWSPNGALIAFWSDRASPLTPQLYWIGINGTGVERLLDQRVDRPTWSPLGFIAFTAGTGSGSEIAVFDVATRRVQVLNDGGGGSNESPAVSPNGRHIAFVTTRWGKEQIAVMDRDGRNVRRVTDAGNNRFPHWQPISR